MRVLAVVVLAALTGCEGTHNLSKANCLPLTVPADVVLVQEAGLYRSPNDASIFLDGHPRDARYDVFRQFTQVKVLAPGTALKVRELTQRWGFDSGLGRISAFGTTQDGDRFEYAWGSDKSIGRAPWEPISVPKLRTIQCEQ